MFSEQAEGRDMCDSVMCFQNKRTGVTCVIEAAHSGIEPESRILIAGNQTSEFKETLSRQAFPVGDIRTGIEE